MKVKQSLVTCLIALCVTLPLTTTYAADAKAPAKAEKAKVVKTVGKVNINTADAVTIASTLKGIGLKKANAIVEHRKQLGGAYSSIEQLLEVKGIGKKTLAKLKSQVSL